MKDASLAAKPVEVAAAVLREPEEEEEALVPAAEGVLVVVKVVPAAKVVLGAELPVTDVFVKVPFA